MRRQSLDTLELKNPGFSKRYNASIPQGIITDYDNTEIPVVRNKTSSLRPLESTGSLKPLLTNRNQRMSVGAIDNQLRSIGSNRKGDVLQPNDEGQFDEGASVRLTLQQDKKDRTNLKFLRYKFNPTEESQHTLGKKTEASYGQYKNQGIPITINMFYERNAVFFQDSRVPNVYKRLFLASFNQ